MFIYYSRTYQSASISVRVEEVTCEKCSTHYFYQMARVGTGQASAPYAIGSATAAQRSKDQAKGLADRRLAEEAEIVPCPHCHWVNEALVSGYRKSCYRNGSALAWGVALLGTVFSLLIISLMNGAPGADRDRLFYAMIAGPAISIGLGVFIYLGRNWLRNQIRPNDTFPHPPKLPRGSPHPLLKNPTTGKLEYAAVQAVRETEPDGWIDFQLGLNGLPATCSSCLSPSEPNSAFHRVLLPGLQLIVPSCASCQVKRKRTQFWTKFWLILLAVLAFMTLPALITHLGVYTWFGVGLVVIFAIVAGQFIGRMTSPVRVKFVDRSRGLLRLWFWNEDYRKLVGSSIGPRS